MDEIVFNNQIRKFLKTVGIQSQREIESAVKQNLENGTLNLNKKLDVSMILEVPLVGLKKTISGEIILE